MVMLAPSCDTNWKPSEFGLIPADWDVFEALDFNPFITSGSRGWAKHYSESGAPFIRITNLSHDDIYPDLSDLRFVGVSDADAEAMRTRLQVGDVLISITADIGAIGYVGSTFPLPSYINQHIACLRLPPQIVDSKYVAYFLASPSSQHRFAAMLDVGAKSGLNLTTIGKLKILCAPLPEQQAIAEALTAADELIAELERLILKKRQVKKAVGQELLSGQRRLPGFVGEWGRQSFGDIFEFLPTATNSRADLNSAGDTYYIHYGDIHTRFHDHLNLRDQQPPRILRQKCRNAAYVRNGDWIMADASEDSDGVCKSVEVLGLSEGNKVVSGLHTFLLREKSPTFVPGFKGHLGNLKSLRDQYLRVMTGMKVFGVSKTALRDLVLPIPRPKEQEAIVRVLSDMEADISALEAKFAKARLIKQGMRRELLTGGIRLI